MREQLAALKRGVEIVVGTPGRVMDHLKRGSLKLDALDYFILDEADEMLDMGFIDDIEAIFAKANPESRVLLFSATMPPAILKIATKFMGDYDIVEEEAPPDEPILTTQRYWVVRESEKIEALVRLIDNADDCYALVFTQTKVAADTLYHALEERGYAAAALHGDIAQSLREKILARFRAGITRILVATDVAAQGIDVEGLTHVVNFDLPVDTQTYIHRIGRTGRAGAKGEAFTLACPEERRKLESLLQAVKKFSKGIIEKGTVPTVEAVLAAKRKRLSARLRSLFAESADPTDTTSDGAQKSTALFAEIVAELSASYGAEKALERVLTTAYGSELDAARYGKVTTMDERTPVAGPAGRRAPTAAGTGRRAGETRTPGSDATQMRLYVALGRDKGYAPREVAQYFSDLLHIPGRGVTNIMVSEHFSLVSLPYAAGLAALAAAKADRSLPPMHREIRKKKGRPAHKTR
jgi:ATP-dependent RNA helicase DeaD